MRLWDRFITKRDKEIFELIGFGRKGGVGKRPALLIIDVTYDFVGDKNEPIKESIKKYNKSCGEVGWRSVFKIAELLEAVRNKNIPIFYSIVEKREDRLDQGRWDNKIGKTETEESRLKGSEIVAEIYPRKQDFVISKKKPSIFFGTPLMSYLNELDIDTVLITGGTTSGCVRAAVVDAFSYNFFVAVIEDCTFDRGEVSHAVNLFDMQMKYADVISLNETLIYLKSLDS